MLNEFKLVDEEGKRQACSLNKKQVQAVVKQNSCQSVKVMSQTLDESTATVSHLLQNIGKVKKTPKMGLS